MTPEHKDIAQIEAYLAQGLPAEEQAAFEKRLEADPTLQDEVAAYRSLFLGFEALQEEGLKADMQTWEAILGQCH